MGNKNNLEKIQKIAGELNFDLVGIAEIASSDYLLAMTEIGERLDDWIKNGYHGEMKWFAETVEKRKDILKVMPDAKSVICVAMNYYSDDKNKKEKNIKNLITHSSAIADECVIRNSRGFNETIGKIARYARGGDYHKIFDKKLKLFAKGLEEFFGEIKQGLPRDSIGGAEIASCLAMTNAKFKYYCDTGPILERMWAKRAGLGFIGKNTNLITKYGSWVLLGEIITNINFPSSKLQTLNSNNCGSCRKCLDACPTGALVAPYTVDARKCISYLTIEHKGEIPMELREKMGNRIFGCDACQEVCPFNIGRQTTGENFKMIQEEHRKCLNNKYLTHLTIVRCVRYENKYEVLNSGFIEGGVLYLKEILAIKTDEEFLKKFAGSPVMRTKRRGLVRNACIAAGNSGDKSLLPYLEECAKDEDSIIAEAAKWAIEKIEYRS